MTLTTKLASTATALRKQAQAEPNGMDRMRLNNLADVLTAEVRVLQQRVRA